MELSHSELAAAHDLGEALLRFVKTLKIVTATEESTRLRPDSVPPVGSKPQVAILLTMREAAKALQISERTLWRLTAPRGPVQSVRLGRSVRYAADELRRVASHFKAD